MSATKPMPVLFIGHGSPMNAIENNDYTQTLQKLGERIPSPKLILCISAHWMTEGTWITHQEKPKTIHDFYGFPQELFDIQYPAPGDPQWADKICSLVTSPKIHPDDEMWGYDHGAWSVLRHMYPKANIPTLQLSLYMERPASYHFKMGEQLRQLRDLGVLIVGSGNIVHNLRMIQWERLAPAHDWATETDDWIKRKLLHRDFDPLINEVTNSPAGKLSIPTWEHYYPLLYVLGASRAEDEMRFEYEGIHNSSISMRSISFGL